jgi:Uma2 family endonuclease
MVQQIPTSEVIYPDNDGKPMSENTEQFKWIVTIKENLELLYANDPNVFVAGDLLWYPIEGDNRTCQAPDALVAFSRPKGYRGSYKQWEEGNVPPQVVFEILSPSNRRGEMAKKLQFYHRHGVEEYYEYDPDRVELIGWQSRSGSLEVIDPIDGWVSPRLGIRFVLTPDSLEIYRPDGLQFLTYVELGQRLEQTNQRLEQTNQQLEQAQAKSDRLAAKLQELGIDPSEV